MTEPNSFDGPTDLLLINVAAGTAKATDAATAAAIMEVDVHELCWAIEEHHRCDVPGFVAILRVWEY